MTRHAIFLRAVNVGGHNKVPMPRLRSALEDLGWTDVESYVQSGNVVADTGSLGAAAVEQQVADVLRREFAVDVDVMVRTKAQLAKVIRANPFASEAKADPTKVHVNFLAKAAPVAAKKAFAPDQFDPERFEFGEKCLYFFYADGAGRSKMGTAPWAKKLGVPGTSRNWRTVLTMFDLISAG
jgi:uncharacterized protein (DUF1697 family)